jgi:hypothetical protein
LKMENSAGGSREDNKDFQFHLRALQNIVAARAGFRKYVGQIAQGDQSET